MKSHKKISRREFVITGAVGTLGIAFGFTLASTSPVVSVVKIKDDNILQASRMLKDIIEIFEPNKVPERPALTDREPSAMQSIHQPFRSGRCGFRSERFALHLVLKPPTQG